MNEFYRFKKFAAYQYKSKTKYYLHSPFVYQFYLHVLEPQPGEDFTPISALRKQLSQDNTIIKLQDSGTGSNRNISIATLEKQVAVKPKYGVVLHRIVSYLKPQTILEIGTSIGISSAYMATANPDARVISLEGDKNLISIARQHYQKLNLTHIENIAGNFDTTLKHTLQAFPKIDMVFFDGNHHQEATLNYFHQCLEKANEKSIFIFDDIYYSPEMTEAWQQIKANAQVRLTLDIFQFGICFFMKEKLAKEDFLLRY